MTVYVDTMRAAFGRMVMCHMVADTTAELHAMADTIGVARRHIQSAGTHREHYDVALAARRKALAAGAVEVTMKELGAILRAKRLAATPTNDRATGART